MKKFLSVITAICLMLTVCLPCFAKPAELTDSDPILDAVTEIEDKVGTVDDEGKEFTSDDAIAAILDKVKGLGVENTDEALDAADQLYNYGAIDMTTYQALQEAIKKDTSLDKDAAKRDIIEKVKEIMADDSLDIPAKAAEIGKLLVGLPAEQVQDILDQLLDSGTIDNDMYTRISDILNNASIDNIGNIFNNGGNAGLGGITDLISNLLGMLGLGGGSDSGDSGNGSSGSGSKSSSGSNSSSSSSGSSTSNQVSTAKTGDYALISVASVAAIAGVAFILTRKNKNNEDE